MAKVTKKSAKKRVKKNIQAMRQAGGHETDYLSGLEMELKTDYERDKREIEELMLHFLPHRSEEQRLNSSHNA